MKKLLFLALILTIGIFAFSSQTKERYEKSISEYKIMKHKYDEAVRYNKSRMVPALDFYGIDTGSSKHIHGFEQELEDAANLGKIKAKYERAYINMKVLKSILEEE